MQPPIYTDRDLTGVIFILSIKGVDRGETPNICSNSGTCDYFDSTEEAYPLTQKRKSCSCSSSYREAGLTHRLLCGKSQGTAIHIQDNGSRTGLDRVQNL